MSIETTEAPTKEEIESQTGKSLSHIGYINQDLLRFHQEIESWKNQGSILFLWNTQKRKQFYSDNGIKLETLIAQINKLTETYFIYENGQPKKGEDGKPILNELLTQEDYDKELKELLSKPVNIRF